MNAPVVTRERRQATRTKAQRLAYINLEPANGGIILNVSEGGLGFHSTAPVQESKIIRFSVTERNRRIEGEGELAWTDQTRKRGGLRFINLPPESREQILSLIRQPLVPRPAGNGERAPIPLPEEIPQFKIDRMNPSSAQEDDLAALMEARKRGGWLSGFSGGLLTGLLVSVLVGSVFMLLNYRQQLGETLIRLGERLGAARESGVTRPRPPQPASPAPVQAAAAPRSSARSAEKAVPEPEITVIKREPVLTVAQPELAKPQPASPAPTGPNADRHVAAATLSNAPVPPAISMPSIVAASKPPLLPNAVTRVELAKPVGPAATTPSISHMYFEVGKYKEKDWAQKVSAQLSELGFRTNVMGKSSFWKNSYYVLVGPYGHDTDAEAAHQTLLSHGFEAHAFERGARNFVLRPGLMLNHSRMPEGACEIRWESYVSDAKVKVLQNDLVVVNAQARWVKSDTKFENNAVVYRINADHSLTLLEFRFAGMDRALVF